MVNVKTSGLAAMGGVGGAGGAVKNEFEAPQKPNLQRTVTIWPIWQVVKEPHAQNLSLFDLTQSSPYLNTPTQRTFAGNNRWWLFNLTTVWGTITSWG